MPRGKGGAAKNKEKQTKKVVSQKIIKKNIVKPKMAPLSGIADFLHEERIASKSFKSSKVKEIAKNKKKTVKTSPAKQKVKKNREAIFEKPFIAEKQYAPALNFSKREAHNEFKFKTQLEDLRAEKVRRLEQNRREENMGKHDKKALLWSLIAFFVATIVFLWFLNINIIFENRKSDQVKRDMDKMSEELDRSLADVKNNVDKTNAEVKASLKEYIPEKSEEERKKEAAVLHDLAVLGEKEKNSATSTNGNSSAKYENFATTSQENIEELKQRLLDLERSLNN